MAEKPKLPPRATTSASLPWRFPADVGGWLTPTEGAKLAELARGKRVLEIGSFEGRSTICMAQTAESVDCVDPFDGRATPTPGSTLQKFCDNIHRYGVTDRVTFNVGTTAEVAPGLVSEYDLIFIDGAHDWQNVATDIRHALRLLAPGGLLAFHDYRELSGEFDGHFDPDVTAAVKGLVAGGATILERADTLAVVRPGRRDFVPLRNRSVYVAVPNTGSIVDDALPGLAAPVRQPILVDGQVKHTRVTLGRGRVSLLALNFNRNWCEALNSRGELGLTHFAMHHSDIAAPEDWVDILVDELERTGADILSAVVRLKDDRGLTTTAVGNGKTMAIRRLTLSECRTLPATFGLADIPWAGKDDKLLVNTGLWVCKFDAPWVEEVCFHVRDQIRRNAAGKFEAVCLSEDWDFSVWAHDRGLKVLATTIVPVVHYGVKGYASDDPNPGRWATDKGDDFKG